MTFKSMDNNNQGIRIRSVEPKVFSLVLRHEKGAYLHTGIHYALEEAYRDARIEMEAVVPELIGTTISLEMWNTLTVDNVRSGFFGERRTISAVAEKPDALVQPQVNKDVGKTALYNLLKNKKKNKIIESIIEDPTKLQALKSGLTKEDIMFIKDKLKNK